MQNQSPAEAAARLKEMTDALEKLKQLPNVEVRSASQGLVRMREELQGQLQSLEEQRENVSEQLVNPMVSGANKTGLEKRIQALDAQIAVIDQQLAEVNNAIARSGGPQIEVRPRPQPQPQSFRISEEAAAISILFILCVMLPITIAFARRIWRRASTVSAIPQEVMDRLGRLDQNLDAVALEVERIGESQRYLTRALAEQQRLSGGQAEPVPAEREKDWQRGP